VKSEREISGMRECHIHDGVALVTYLAWLNEEVNLKNKTINEYEAALKVPQ
jgi:Xaa-Pro aminopeptidase